MGELRILEDLFDPPIHIYTRAEALEDGVLVDVSELAQEAGIKFPVAITARLHAGWITPSEIEQKHGQDYVGRLWDTLWMLRCAIKGSAQGSLITYRVIYATEMVRCRSRLKQVTVELKAVCGPGDQGEPVITIMLPDED